MNQNQNLPNESNAIPIIDSNIPLTSKNENLASSPYNNSGKENDIKEQKNIENENDTTTLNQAENEQNCITGVNESSKLPQKENNSNLNFSENSFNNNNPNPFSKVSISQENHDMNSLNQINQKIKVLNDEQKDAEKNIEINSKKNKSQLVRKSFNYNSKPQNFGFESTMKINLVQSQNKKRKTNCKNINLDNFVAENEVNDENKFEKKSIISDFNDKKYKYKSLIKRLAGKLKKKVKPASKGYFYVNIIKTDKYLKKVKKIAKKMKISIFPPTHGFFYSFLEKEKKYKLLVKKIALLLKKRIHFPTCKIVKIYEPYRQLIKRIADSLKNSLKKKEKEATIFIENKFQSNVENNNTLNSNGINNTNLINNNKENNESNDINDMDIEIENNDNKINYEDPKEIPSPNDFKSLTYSKTDIHILSQHIYFDNTKYAFSKMDIIQEEIPKSVATKKCSNYNYFENKNSEKIETEEVCQIKNVEQNTKEPLILMTLNTNNIESNIIQETNIENPDHNLKNKENGKIQKEKINNEEKIEPINHKIINDDLTSQDKEKEKILDVVDGNLIDSNNVKSIPCLSKKNKNIILSISSFKKEYFKVDEERRIQNRSHTINDINLSLNLDNFNYLNNNGKEKNIEINDKKISLSDINVSDSDFASKFHKFLEQEKIEIIDNAPSSLNTNNLIYFEQSTFWYFLIIYIFIQNNNLSLYSIIHLLEQYYIWSKDKNERQYFSIKEKINEYIDKNFPKETIEQFLYMNKYQNLNKILQKFEFSNKLYDYKEIKIDNININCDKNYQCQCDLCTNDIACIQKICDLNKKKNNVISESSIYLEKAPAEEIHSIYQKNLIERVNRNNILHNNEEIFFKNISKKKANIFSKSKTIFVEKPNIEYNYIANLIHDNSVETVDINKTFDDNIIIIENKVDNENISDNIGKDNNNENIIVDYEEDKKSFKNISKNKPLNIQGKKEIENSKNTENSENSEKKEEKEEIELSNSEKKENGEKDDDNKKNEIEEKEKEIEESSDEENKNNKNEKKNKKAKNKKTNKKRKEFIKIKNNDDKKENEKNEKEEKNEEEKRGEEKSYKKKRKTGNNIIKKNIKSKAIEKNKDEEKNELREMLKDDNDNEKEKENEDEAKNNSNKKKSKSPNRKKNRKH